MQTETLDKMYLEWSRFTKAKTERELRLEAALEKIETFGMHDAPATFPGSESDWQQQRISEMKKVAHAALNPDI